MPFNNNRPYRGCLRNIPLIDFIQLPSTLIPNSPIKAFITLNIFLELQIDCQVNVSYPSQYFLHQKT